MSKTLKIKIPKGKYCHNLDCSITCRFVIIGGGSDNCGLYDSEYLECEEIDEDNALLLKCEQCLEENK